MNKSEISMNLQQYIDDFERYLLTEKRVSHNTFDAYKRDLSQFTEFMTRHAYNITLITNKELKEFLKELRQQALTASSVSRKISCLKTFFKHLEEKYGLKNYSEQLILPKLEKKLPQFLNEQEIERLLTYAQTLPTDNDKRNYVMLHVLYATGMRISELTELRLSALDFESGFIKNWAKKNS